MRLYVEDTYHFPEATRDDLQKAFDAFEGFVARYRSPHRQISDLDLAVDLGKRALSFTWFTDVRGDDDEWPRYYVSVVRDIAGHLGSYFMLDRDLPRTIVNNHFTIHADDDSFLATGELVFTVPAP